MDQKTEIEKEKVKQEFQEVMLERETIEFDIDNSHLVRLPIRAANLETYHSIQYLNGKL